MSVTDPCPYDSFRVRTFYLLSFKTKFLISDRSGLKESLRDVTFNEGELERKERKCFQSVCNVRLRKGSKGTEERVKRVSIKRVI